MSGYEQFPMKQIERNWKLMLFAPALQYLGPVVGCSPAHACIAGKTLSLPQKRTKDGA